MQLTFDPCDPAEVTRVHQILGGVGPAPAQQTGAAPMSVAVAASAGVAPAAVMPGVAPAGVAPAGVAPAGVAPAGVAPAGGVPGVAPAGVVPGVAPAGVMPGVAPAAAAVAPDQLSLDSLKSDMVAAIGKMNGDAAAVFAALQTAVPGFTQLPQATPDMYPAIKAALNSLG